VVEYNWLGQDYKQNEVLLFDDFRKSDLAFNKVLKITDVYPYALPVRAGSPIPLKSPNIIFTTPKSILNTYGENGGDDVFQLLRRVCECNSDLKICYDWKAWFKIDKELLKANYQKVQEWEKKELVYNSDDFDFEF
jgi:hypothetical protein